MLKFLGLQSRGGRRHDYEDDDDDDDDDGDDDDSDDDDDLMRANISGFAKQRRKETRIPCEDVERQDTTWQRGQCT